MRKTNSGDDKTNANFITSSRNAKAQLANLQLINQSTSRGDRRLFPLIIDLNGAAAENKGATF